MTPSTGLINKIAESPRKIFTIDAIGAIVSALSLYVLVLPLNTYFGVPLSIVWILGGVSLAFFLFSLFCNLTTGKHDAIKLRIVITANLLYGILTAILVLWNHSSITGLGIAYFVAEYSVIIALVLLERECLKKLNSSK
jgi:hypothetical protein